MKKIVLFSSLLLIWLNTYQPANYVSSNFLNPLKVQYSNNIVDNDLLNLGIDINDISINSQKMIAASEESIDGNNYLIFFVFDKNLEKEITSINLTFKSGIDINEFKSCSAQTKKIKTQLVGESSNGCCKKYITKAHGFLLNPYREYTFGTATLDNGEITAYPFTYTIDNNNYQFEIKDTITLNNTKAVSIYLEEHNDISQSLLGSRGDNNIMYGLTLDKHYQKDQLQEIEFLYDLYDFEAVACGNQFLWVETLKTSKGFFDEKYFYSAEFKSHGITYSEDELKEIKKYFPDYYALKEANVDKIVSNTTYETKTHGIFKHNTYKWDSIIKMDELENHAEEATANLIRENFEEFDYVITIDSFPVEKRQDSLVGNKAKLCQLQKDQLHKAVGTKERDPRYWWLKDKYGITSDWPSYDTMYYCSSMPKDIEVVRMKFVDSKNNPYDLSVISTPQEISDFVGDSSSEKNLFTSFIFYLQDIYKNYSWIFYTIIGLAALLGVSLILSPFINLRR